jgi:predicted dehydrogenase/threonine dehydrogenase-like Zn-dependent dehydrogenase
MKQVLIRSGSVLVDEVAAPIVSPKRILVSVRYSCISAGTELASVAMSSLPLYRRALKQPEHVRRALTMMKDQGVKRTLDRVLGKLAAGTPTGYSAAGRVIAVGQGIEGFAMGDLVACAGAGIANHAEVIDVPVNLAVPIPSGLGLDKASTVTLGAIAMQGVRRTQPTLGETIVVVGLGILGQIAAQLLKANGCRVIGVDTDQRRVALALENGLDFGLDPVAEDYVERAHKLTDGFGADAVVITAATSSDRVVSEAMRACRRKGRVVLVGDVGLQLNRADFYSKELDFLISTSYGPGRYDPVYEEGGQDYPLAYVRWTENRNMEAYLRMLADGRIRLENLTAEPYDVDRASEAYASLRREGERPIIALLSYPERSESLNRTVMHRRAKHREAAWSERIRVALVGAGGFAQGMHLPNLMKLRADYELHCVASKTGSNAKAIATQYEAVYSTTDYEQVLTDSDVDLVLIATRHDLHARMALEALRAGKNVLVEKPLALSEKELIAIEDFFARTPNAPLLLTGFNRRFSPAMRAVSRVLQATTTPLVVNYRMNAGYIPLEHWTQGPEGGGRNIGEACHIYDLFNYLTQSPLRRIRAESISSQSKQWSRNDNFAAIISYESGSLCTLTYTALGNRAFPKEQMDIFTDGKVISLEDYKSLTVTGGRHAGWKSNSSQKGQLEELEAIAQALRHGMPWPIPLEQQIQATRISLEVERQIYSATPERKGFESCAE